MHTSRKINILLTQWIKSFTKFNLGYKDQHFFNIKNSNRTQCPKWTEVCEVPSQIFFFLHYLSIFSPLCIHVKIVTFRREIFTTVCTFLWNNNT